MHPYVYHGRCSRCRPAAQAAWRAASWSWLATQQQAATTGRRTSHTAPSRGAAASSSAPTSRDACAAAKCVTDARLHQGTIRAPQSCCAGLDAPPAAGQSTARTACISATAATRLFTAARQAALGYARGMCSQCLKHTTG